MLEARREREAVTDRARSRQERLVEAKRRLDEELAVEHAANRGYEHTVRPPLTGWAQAEQLQPTRIRTRRRWCRRERST